MPMAENEKVAIVTGAARGIGREIVRELAAAGMTVVAVDLSENVKALPDWEITRTVKNAAGQEQSASPVGEKDLRCREGHRRLPPLENGLSGSHVCTRGPPDSAACRRLTYDVTNPARKQSLNKSGRGFTVFWAATTLPTALGVLPAFSS